MPTPSDSDADRTIPKSNSSSSSASTSVRNSTSKSKRTKRKNTFIRCTSRNKKIIKNAKYGVSVKSNSDVKVKCKKLELEDEARIAVHKVINGRERHSLKAKEEVLSMKEEAIARSEKKLSLRGNNDTNTIPASIIEKEGVQVGISSLPMMSNSTNDNKMKRDARKQQVKIKESLE